MNTAIVIPARRQGRAWAIAAALAVLLAGGPVDAKPRTEIIRGPAMVLDGDTLLVAGRKVRLLDADAFEAGQMCHFGDNPWPCGDMATAAMEALVKGHDVTCQLIGRHSYGRELGRCQIGDGEGKTDLAGWLVAEGLAIVDPRFGATYQIQQDKAKAAKRGAWGGTFDMPCRFRGSC